MEVVLIDAGGANIGSVSYALERLGANPTLSSNASDIMQAERVILPGVGAADVGMARLRELGLVEVVQNLRQPLLGICLGMQLLFDSSEEGDVECLGLLSGRVRRLNAAPGLRVPHMGWNSIDACAPDVLLDAMPKGGHAYFVHSYAVPVTVDAIATTTHGQVFASMVRRGNVAGAQFHPERSAAVGARLLENFLSGARS